MPGIFLRKTQKSECLICFCHAMTGILAEKGAESRAAQQKARRLAQGEADALEKR
nr:MAG TPA: MCSS domain [Caudoviricetes sp.]